MPRYLSLSTKISGHHVIVQPTFRTAISLTSAFVFNLKNYVSFTVESSKEDLTLFPRVVASTEIIYGYSFLRFHQKTFLLTQLHYIPIAQQQNATFRLIGTSFEV